MRGEQGMRDARETFDCPITWCEGDVSEHGGEAGEAPQDWLHRSPIVPIVANLGVMRFATGSGADMWQVFELAGKPEFIEPSAEALARGFEDAAATVRALASVRPA